MIIILISIAAVAGWSYALFQNSKISKSNQHGIEQESIADALRVHVIALESLVADKAAEIRHLKSTIQSLNDKSKATKNKKVDKDAFKIDRVAPTILKAESKPEVVKAASKKTYKKKSN
jgi:hypothetical protein